MDRTNESKYTKYLVFAIILFVLILAWLGSYWLKYKSWPWLDFQQALKKAETEPEKEKINSKEGIGEGELQKKKSELFRQGMMNDLVKKINEISPVKPITGGKWHVVRFWFASDRDIYIEYEDGQNIRRILLQVEGVEEKPEYKIIGYFEPGENDWILKEGNDTMFGRLLDLYEFDKESGEWIKKN